MRTWEMQPAGKSVSLTSGWYLSALLLLVSAHSHAMDIWGQGEVPRITDPKDVPQTLPEIWKGYNECYDKHNPLEAVVHKTWETPDGIVVNWVQVTGHVPGEEGRRLRLLGLPQRRERSSRHHEHQRRSADGRRNPPVASRSSAPRKSASDRSAPSRSDFQR